MKFDRFKKFLSPTILEMDSNIVIQLVSSKRLIM